MSHLFDVIHIIWGARFPRRGVDFHQSGPGDGNRLGFVDSLVKVLEDIIDLGFNLVKILLFLSVLQES